MKANIKFEWKFKETDCGEQYYHLFANDIEIAIIAHNRIENQFEGELFYEVKPLFPDRLNYGRYVAPSVDLLKKPVEQRFTDFIQKFIQ